MKIFNIVLFSTASILLSFSEVIANQNEELLQMVVQYRDANLLDILMKYGKDPKFPPLNQAMEAGDYNAVIILLEYGVNVNMRGPNTSEMWWNPSIRRWSSIYNNQSTTLELAIERGEKELIKMLLEKGADPYLPRMITYTLGDVIPANSQLPNDKQGRRVEKTTKTTTAIYDAIITGRLDILDIFVEFKVDLNKTCIEYQGQAFNPLQWAIHSSKQDVAQYLMAHGAKY